MKSTLIVAVFISIIYVDIILADEQYERTSEAGQAKTDHIRQRRAAVRDDRFRWPGGVIPYVFASRDFSLGERRLIKMAIRTWEKYTCLAFRKAKGSEKNYIYFKKGDSCWSWYGLHGGGQVVSLNESCGEMFTLSLHELGHAIGLYHTVARRDRDDHVVINFDNVDNIHHSNFEMIPKEKIHNFGVGFDYHSIMHYHKKEGGNGGLVIKTINPKFQNIIGRYQTLSFGDIKIVNKMYKCKPSSCKLKDSDCQGSGFVDASCKCICPGEPSGRLPTKPCYTKDYCRLEYSDCPGQGYVSASCTCICPGKRSCLSYYEEQSRQQKKKYVSSDRYYSYYKSNPKLNK